MDTEKFVSWDDLEVAYLELDKQNLELIRLLAAKLSQPQPDKVFWKLEEHLHAAFFRRKMLEKKLNLVWRHRKEGKPTEGWETGVEHFKKLKHEISMYEDRVKESYKAFKT